MGRKKAPNNVTAASQVLRFFFFRMIYLPKTHWQATLDQILYQRRLCRHAVKGEIPILLVPSFIYIEEENKVERYPQRSVDDPSGLLLLLRWIYQIIHSFVKAAVHFNSPPVSSIHFKESVLLSCEISVWDLMNKLEVNKSSFVSSLKINEISAGWPPIPI